MKALDLLAAAAPQTLSFKDILAKSEIPAESLAAEQEHLAKSLFQLTARGLVELTFGEFSFRTEITDKPRASRFVRFQAASGDEVTNLRHELLTLQPGEAAVLKLLDGTRTASELAQVSGQSLTDVMASLERFAKGALLEN